MVKHISSDFSLYTNPLQTMKETRISHMVHPQMRELIGQVSPHLIFIKESLVDFD